MKREIILASKSKQRSQILKSLGLKFRIIESKIKEDRRIVSGCSQLVKRNALKKARDVAGKVRRGVVIGADTLVLVGKNKIIGKPKTLADAKRTLQILSARPQWVYTGLAVIDIDNKKEICDYEKTKVFMQKLSDKEMRGYFSQITPFDKAGSFDIQGRGSMFIKRIEGCFYNVVGLPTAKLYQMLKKIGINALMLVLVFVIFGLYGCATEYNVATGKEDIILYDTDKEMNLGRSLSRAYEKEYKLTEDVSLQERVRKIGDAIAAVSDRKDVNYYFRVVDGDDVNAFSLPGGYVYVFKGLIDKVANDDELASVLAHEVGHIVAKHHIKKLQAAYGYAFLNILVAQATTPDFAGGMNLAMAQIMSAYSREDEFLADKMAIIYTKRAGYKPEAMISFLKKLKEVDKDKIQPINYFRSHPYLPERIARARQILYGTMDFSDYLNLE